MSTLLEEKIKAIMSGEYIAEKFGDDKKEDDSEQKDDKEDKDVADQENDGQDPTDDSEDDQENSNGDDQDGEDKEGDDDKEDDTEDKEDTEDEPSGKSDKVKVSEQQTQEGDMVKENIPGLGKDMTAAPADESGASKTSKTVAGLSRKLGDKFKLAMDASADKQDDNGDNAKIQKGESQKEAGGKLKAEHMEAMFAGEELTEDFKSKASTIFETAVEAVVAQRLAEAEEEFQLRLSEAVEAVTGELVEQIDDYLQYAVNEWSKDNEVALESGIRSEISESFIDGLKTLFQEHYVDIPEGKTDIVAGLSEQVETLQATVAALQEEKEAEAEKALMLAVEAIVVENAKGLTAIEQDKYRELVENVEFSTKEEFAGKAKTIRESYFRDGKQAHSISQEVTKTVAESSNIADSVLSALQSGNQMKFVRN